MWALVESGSITKFINNPKGLVIGDVRIQEKYLNYGASLN